MHNYLNALLDKIRIKYKNNPKCFRIFAENL